MAWYDNAVFYHIYPLGMADCPPENQYQLQEHRINRLLPWLPHIRDIGSTAIYIGPLFESVGHGYETTDYYKLDSRLGDHVDLKNYIRTCHQYGLRVVVDGVFNHVGRDFFAFRDLLKYRENSRYLDWFCNVNFYGNNEYNDCFSYDNWGGYNLLVKLNLRHPEVSAYLLDVVRYWVSEFDIDGIRLDAADVLDFGFMEKLRDLAENIKPEFWLMGEVIHGDYAGWVNDRMLHAVTNYQLHKALYSGHNEHNYFEIAHTVRHLMEQGKVPYHLYNFADNHDVERIFTRLHHKQHYLPLHILLYTLPGIPSIYYGSEFGIEGRKEKASDRSLRPALNFEDFRETAHNHACTAIISSLGKIRRENTVFGDGIYQELLLRNRQFVFSRTNDNCQAIVAVNNDDADITVEVNAAGRYTELLSGEILEATDRLRINLHACSGQIWIRDQAENKVHKIDCEIVPDVKEPVEEPVFQTKEISHKSYEEMSVEELQICVLAKLAANGPVTEQMKKDVFNNIYRDSLLNWVRSFRN